MMSHDVALFLPVCIHFGAQENDLDESGLKLWGSKTNCGAKVFQIHEATQNKNWSRFEMKHSRITKLPRRLFKSALRQWKTARARDEHKIPLPREPKKLPECFLGKPGSASRDENTSGWLCLAFSGTVLSFCSHAFPMLFTVLRQKERLGCFLVWLSGSGLASKYCKFLCKVYKELVFLPPRLWSRSCLNLNGDIPQMKGIHKT